MTMAENASPSGEGNPIPAVEPAPNPAATATGTEPAKPASGTQAFDPTTLTNEEFEKFYSDPRTFDHPRFKSLAERAKKADELEKAQQEADTNRLKDEKKWQELAEKQENRANDVQQRFETSTIDNKIVIEATKLGITDLDAATKLLDRTGISINEQGEVSGVEEAVKALAESKTYLVDKNQIRTIGSPSNPANPNQSTAGTKQFKASEIGDPAFYKEHEKEIDASLRAGVKIIDDRPAGI